LSFPSIDLRIVIENKVMITTKIQPTIDDGSITLFHKYPTNKIMVNPRINSFNSVLIFFNVYYEQALPKKL